MNISFIKRVGNWAIKGAASILDQGIFSAANFILSVLLARWIMPSDYGAYSIALAVYQFAYQAHNAIIIEPMSVLGPARVNDRLPDFFRDQIKLHFALGIVASFIICLIGLAATRFSNTLGGVLILMGMVSSALLFPILMRRGFYLFGNPESALLGSVVYLVSLVGAFGLTRMVLDVSVYAVFPLMGVAGLVGGAALWKRLPPPRSASASLHITWSQNWTYGRWLIYSSLFLALAAQIQTLVVGGLLGLGDAGAFRALQNFIQPIIIIFAALSAVLLPSLSHDYGIGNILGLKRKGRNLLIVLITVSVAFELLLLISSSALNRMAYGAKFLSYTSLIPIWGLAPIAAAMTYAYYFLLQSIQRSRAVLIGSVVWAAASTISSVVFSLRWGILGATVSVATGYLASGIAFAGLFWYHISKLNSPGSV